MESRKAKEKSFHDQLRTESFGQRWSPCLEEKIKTDPMWSNMKFYSIERKSRLIVEKWLVQNSRGKTVLDYCCGNGEDTLFIAKNGAGKVVGIDISNISINNCLDRSVKENVSNIASFAVMDAENLEFADNTFDIVTEYGALHHIDLEKGYSEIARVLKPDGKGIFVEALGHNPIIHQYRKRTLKLRTEWEVEHILRKKEIEKARIYFNQVEILGFFHLASLGAVPFRNLPAFKIILGMFEALDGLLLKLPLIKWQAWQIVFVLSQPKYKK